jgi:hypothetical protein
MEPVKGVKEAKEAETEKKTAEKTIVAKENEDKTGVDDKKHEELKGVKEVDTKV